MIQDGCIVEQGNHDQLLAIDGLYAELVRTQLGDDMTATNGNGDTNTAVIHGEDPQSDPVEEMS